MIEIKFLKDLPIKVANTNKSVLTVLGGDIYYDSEGNRYGFISFKNPNKSPIFAMQLAIKEYSVDGKFIRDNELFEGYTYYPSGEFVINQPILLDKETEAVEINIVKLTFKKFNFVNNRFVSFKTEDYTNLYQTKAPVKKSSGSSTFVFASAPQNTPASEPQAAPVEGAPVNEAPNNEADVVNAEVPQADAPVNEPVQKPVAKETPVAELRRYGKEKKLFFSFLPFVAAAIVLLIFLFISMYAAAGGVAAAQALVANK